MARSENNIRQFSLELSQGLEFYGGFSQLIPVISTKGRNLMEISHICSR